MTLTEKLDELLRRRGMTRGRLASETGIPYNTIVGFYTKGYSNMKLSNLRRLVECLEVSADVLTDDSRDLDEKTDETVKALIKKYSALSEKGRSLIDSLTEGVWEMENETEKPPAKVEFIKEYLTPAAAGYASPAEGEDYVLTEKTPDMPPETDFTVRISGDSMEPYIKDGSRVCVTRDIELKDGDVGIFFVDGDMKCKQYCEDAYGNIYLFSLNRERSDADTHVLADSGITVFCFGRVLLPKRPPLPRA